MRNAKAADGDTPSEYYLEFFNIRKRKMNQMNQLVGEIDGL